MAIIKPQVEKILPGAARAFARHGRSTLVDLSRALTAPGSPPSAALRRAVRRLTLDSYGPEAADRAEAALAAGRPVMWANHHGFDTHPEMVQGGLFFSLADILAAGPGRPAPPLLVLAGSLVSLGNPTCPGGWLLGRRGPDGRHIRRFVFPRDENSRPVSHAPALTSARLDEAWRKVSRLDWRPSEKTAIRRLLDEFLLTSDFLDRPDFLAQASWLASALWAVRLPGPGQPELIHLESERVAEACLLDDLTRPDSPLSRLLTEPKLRTRLLEALADHRGCWAPRLLAPGLEAEALGDSSQPLGTVLFWEIDGRGRRYSMGLPYEVGRARLTGPTLRLPLAPAELAEALTRGRIRPGLFLSCLTFAHHGLVSFGGVFMIDYQPDMLKTAADILETPLPVKTGRSDFQLVAGPLAVGLTEGKGGGPPWPAGAVEFLAAGSLPLDFFRRWGELRLEEIWDFTAGEWYQEEVPMPLRAPGWEKELPLEPPLTLPLSSV